MLTGLCWHNGTILDRGETTMGAARSRDRTGLNVDIVPNDILLPITAQEPMLSRVNRATMARTRALRERASRRRARAAGYGGLEPGAGPEDIEATYIWGAENDRDTQRMLRPHYPQVVGARTRGSAARVRQPFDPGFGWVSEVRQGSRRPQDVAALYRAAAAGQPRLSSRVTAGNPAIVRPYLDAASDHDRAQLIFTILTMHQNSRDDALRQLAHRSLVAAIQTPDNPGGVPAPSVFDNVVVRGSPEMVESLMRHLPPNHFNPDNHQALSLAVSRRHNVSSNKRPGDHDAVRALFPPGYLHDEVDTPDGSDQEAIEPDTGDDDW